MKKHNKIRKILIFGRGQIGPMYHSYFHSKGYLSKLSSKDITRDRQLSNEIEKFKPHLVINTAAKTSLEWAEKHKLEAFNVNVLGADNIAGICEDKQIYFIHLSSGCIFESSSKKDVKKEDDIPNPAAFYSWTKVWAENLITSRRKLKYLILRPRQPVSSQVSEKNMLIKMLTFSKFVGEDGGWNSGTVLEDMMWITEKLFKMGKTGIYHVANQGYTTPYDIALLLKKYVNPKMKFSEISHKKLDKIMPVKRVATVLEVSKLKKIGINPGRYEDRLEEIIKMLGENIRKKVNEKVLANTATTSKERTTTTDTWKQIFKNL
jgi:dTDP-4-dehydrorhamnose reductase